MANHAPVTQINSQELRDLILPILACLPTAFLAPQPPPALYPLLSPILRQRVHLLSAASSRNAEPLSQGSWLKLLTWSAERAERLADVVSRLQLEPHPVSGELELFGDTSDPDAGRVWYRRLDEETVQARCDVKEYGLGFVYVWSTNDTGGIGLENGANAHPKDGWKVAEVVPLDSDENLLELEGWQEDLHSVKQSNQRSTQDTANGTTSHVAELSIKADEDAYWASYDRTPDKETPSTTRTGLGPNLSENRAPAEHEYFTQYGQVQPAMDAHDPDGVAAAFEVDGMTNPVTAANAHVGQPHDSISSRQERADYENFMNLNHAIEQPNESSKPSSKHAWPPTNHQPASQDPVSASVISLERHASEASAAMEISVKHHISTEIKSLSRLAQGAGIAHEDFAELVQRELGLLSLVEL